MTAARPRALTDRLRRHLLAGVLVLALQAPSAEAFQHRSVTGLEDLLCAALALPSPDRRLSARDEVVRGFGLGTVVFGLAGASSERTLGAGWFGGATGALEYFTAAGLKVSDTSPSEGADQDLDDRPFAVGPWAGTGLAWGPTGATRFALEARWTAAQRSLAGDPGTLCRFLAGASFALRW